MRNRNLKGFTLIELLIVIAIIGILAAVLIPNLLSARERAFDTAAQTCLKEIATFEELAASNNPWNYTAGAFAGTYDEDGSFTIGEGVDAVTTTVGSCRQVTVESTTAGDALDFYEYDGSHANGGNTYRVATGSGVVFQATGTIDD